MIKMHKKKNNYLQLTVKVNNNRIIDIYIFIFHLMMTCIFGDM